MWILMAYETIRKRKNISYVCRTLSSWDSLIWKDTRTVIMLMLSSFLHSCLRVTGMSSEFWQMSARRKWQLNNVYRNSTYSTEEHRRSVYRTYLYCTEHTTRDRNWWQDITKEHLRLSTPSDWSHIDTWRLSNELKYQDFDNWLCTAHTFARVALAHCFDRIMSCNK